MQRRRWTEQESADLAFRWGEESVEQIGEHLGRTPRSVEVHAAALKIRSTQGRLTALALARILGVSQPTVVKALKALGIDRRKPRSNARKAHGRGAGWHAIDDDGARRVRAWLGEHCRRSGGRAA